MIRSVLIVWTLFYPIADFRSPKVDCSQVRLLVSWFNGDKNGAISWARRNGYSEEHISAARRCFR